MWNICQNVPCLARKLIEVCSNTIILTLTVFHLGQHICTLKPDLSKDGAYIKYIFRGNKNLVPRQIAKKKMTDEIYNGI